MQKNIFIASLCLALTAGLIMTLTGCGKDSSQAQAAPGTESPARVVTTSPSPSPAPTTTDLSSSTAKRGPLISFAKLTHNFGSITDVTKQTCTFPFTNTGDETLIISEIKTSCGCTATSLSKNEFLPGESSEIEVSFSPKGNGRQSKTITVISNATSNSVRTLSIIAEITPIIILDPVYLRFGTIALGENHTRIVTVKGRYPQMIVDSIVAPNSFISAGIMSENGKIPSQEFETAPDEYKIYITLNKNMRWGGFYSTVQIRTKTYIPETGEIIPHTATVHVNAQVYGEIHASGTMFRIGQVSPGASFENIIRLTRPSGAPFKILQAKLQNISMPNVTLEIEPLTTPGISGYNLILRGDSKSYLGAINGSVLVNTDVAGENQFVLTVAGMVRPLKR